VVYRRCNWRLMSRWNIGLASQTVGLNWSGGRAQMQGSVRPPTEQAESLALEGGAPAHATRRAEDSGMGRAHRAGEEPPEGSAFGEASARTGRVEARRLMEVTSRRPVPARHSRAQGVASSSRSYRPR
jgi:hypothetical protein